MSTAAAGRVAPPAPGRLDPAPRGTVLAWLLPAVDLGRVAWLRTLVHLVAVLDVLVFTDSTAHGATPQLYRPLLVDRLLGLPAPTTTLLQGLQVVVVVGSLVVATGRLPRLAGWPVAAAYLLWHLYGMAFGKVDHDELAMVVALVVLPTAGRARHRDRCPTEAAGFAVRCVQLAVVATYLLSAYAKIRWTGWGWPDSAIFVWAITRRGNAVSRLLLQAPELLRAAQWGLIGLEVLSPVLLLVPRLAVAGVVVFALFHLATYAAISIHFLPTAICLTAFLPLEQLGAGRTARSRRHTVRGR